MRRRPRPRAGRGRLRPGAGHVPRARRSPRPGSRTASRPGHRTRATTSGLPLRDCIEHIEVMLACLQAARGAVNVNYRYVAEEVAYLCHDAGLVAIVSAHSQADAMRALDVAAPDRGGRRRRAAPVETGARRVRGAPRGRGRRRATSRPGRATTTTSSTPAGPPGYRRASCGARRTSSSPRSAAGTPAVHRSGRPRRSGPASCANPAGRVAAFLGPDDPVPDLVALALGPLVHASGQWSTLGTLLSGGTVVLYAEPHVDAAAVLDLVDRERVVALNLVGDAVARPLVERLEARPGAWRHLVAPAARVGREHPLG